VGVTREEAEEVLAEWAAMIQDRDNLARAAVAPGVRKHRVRVLTGISRTTIGRILAPVGPVGPSMGHQRPKMITDASQGLRALARSPWSVAEARGFEPRKGANPNRISSAAP
jgi:hypothetical protein